MAVTTTENIGEWKPRPCDKCGMALDPMTTQDYAGRWVHDVCPPENGSLDQGSDIAHDPFARKNGASLAALERLRLKGKGMKLMKRSRPDVGEVHEYIGGRGNWTRHQRPKADIDAELGRIVLPSDDDETVEFLDAVNAVGVVPSPAVGPKVGGRRKGGLSGGTA